METKDLVLLMMIPLILVSLIVYTGKSPSITGAQTVQITQAADNNVLGTYSIMPSFKAKIDYNMQEDYKKIIIQLNKIISDCKTSLNIGECFKAYSTKLNWSCVELRDEAADILYDFIDKFNECLNLEESNVVCRFFLDERDIINRPIKSFDIILTDEVQRTRIELRQDTEVWKAYVNYGNLAYTSDYNTKDTISNSTNPVKYVVEYQGRKPLTMNAVAIDKVPVQLSKMFLFYKTGNELKFIEASQEGNFRAGIPANKIIDVPRVNGFRFCAKTGKQVYAYDESDKSVKLRDVVYRFAVKYSR